MFYYLITFAPILNYFFTNMLNIDKKIIAFIKEHHVLTIASAVNDQPWCAHCFYAYLENENQFIFSSDTSTKHVNDFNCNNKVAGSIVLETELVGKIQGIQLKGEIIKPEGSALIKAQERYIKRFPFTILMNTTLWILQANYIKMTDNRLGFGKKLIWDLITKETTVK